MSNLLEKASILLTPTAYDDGKILSVKPEEVLGEELVVNGDFSDGSTSWNFGTGWSIVNGDASHTGSGSYIEQGSLTQGVSYKVVINVTQASGSGFPQIYMGGLTTAMTSVGVYTFNIVAVANDKIKIRGLNDCKISSVSVKQETDGDFDFTRNSSATRVNSQGLIEDMQILSGNLVSNGDFSQEGAEQVTNGDFATDSDWINSDINGFSISGGKLNLSNVAYAKNTSQSNVTTVGKTYKVTFEISDYVKGSVRIFLGGSVTPIQSSNGVFTSYVTVSANTTIGIQTLAGDGSTLSIDNVSIKEVGQNWTFSNVAGAFGWRIANKRAICDAEGVNNGRNLNSSTTLVNGKTYKLTLDILQSVDGMNIIIGSTILPSELPTGTNLAYEYYIYASQHSGGLFSIYGQTSDLQEITNISLIEITDDTNLPRINYEGFSYQDSLGSEEIVNGSFGNGSANWSLGTQWNVINDELKCDANGTTQLASQESIGEINKTFKYSIDVSSSTLSGQSLKITLGANQSIHTLSGSNETLIGYLQCTSSTPTGVRFSIIVGSSQTSGEVSIDNVSVKEVTGQEPIPDSGCGSWLFEPQSTNLITQSENFSSVDWTKTLVTASANDAASPSGEVNASLIQETVYTSSIPSLRITNNIPISAGKHTLSFYVKNNSGRYLGISFGNNTNRIRTTFDFDTETFKTPLFNGITEGEVSYTTIGDYYRILITANFTSGLAALVYIMPLATDSYPFFEFQNSDNRSFYLWGAQVEASSYATSYIPTSGSTATRLGETAKNAGGAGVFNSGEGVLYAELSGLVNGGVDRSISLSDGTTSNYLRITLHANSNRIAFFSGNGVNYNNYDFSQSSDLKMAFQYKENDWKIYINGTLKGTDTSALTFSPNTLSNLSFSLVSTSPFYGKTKNIQVFNYALTDEELQTLTK
jgi:hypothetical protein